MSPAPQHKMSVDEFLARTQRQPGRYEMFGGTVYARAPEPAVHALDAPGLGLDARDLFRPG